MSRSRALLHRNKLRDFAAWAVNEGYSLSETVGEYEVLRLRLTNNSKPIIVYERLSGDHCTVFDEGLGLVKKWLRERPSARS